MSYVNKTPMKETFETLIHRLPASWFSDGKHIVSIVLESHKSDVPVTFSCKTYPNMHIGDVKMNGMNVDHMIGFPDYFSMFIEVDGKKLTMGTSSSTPFNIIRKDAWSIRHITVLEDEKYNFTADTTSGIPMPLTKASDDKLIDRVVSIVESSNKEDNLYDNKELKDLCTKLAYEPDVPDYAIESNGMFLITQIYNVNCSSYILSKSSMWYNRFNDVSEGTKERHHMTLAQYLRILIDRREA